MTDWTARAKAAFAETEHLPTAKTDESGVSAVSSVGVWAVLENGTLAADLVEAAMLVCDRHGDGEAAREQMRQDCLATPAHLRADLLEHFLGKRPTAKGKP